LSNPGGIAYGLEVNTHYHKLSLVLNLYSTPSLSDPFSLIFTNISFETIPQTCRTTQAHN
jgi:hypothetical protein